MDKIISKKFFLRVLVVNLLLAFVVWGQKDAQDLYSKAMKSKTPSERITLLTQAISVNPALTLAYFALGKAYKQQGDLAEAEKHLQRALIANPTGLDEKLRFEIIFEIGVIQRALGNLVRAHDSFLAAKQLTNDSKMLSEIFYNLGDLNLELEKIDDALTFFLEGKKLAPNDSRFTSRIDQIREERKLYEAYLEGNKHYSMQRYQEALAAYQRVLDLNPNFKDVQAKSTEIQQKLEEQRQLASRSKLEQLYVKGVDFLENSQLVNDNELIKETNATDSRSAEKEPKVTRPEPETSELEAAYQRGMQQLNAGNWEAAISEFGKVSAADPAHRDVAQRLIYVQNKLQAERLNPAKQRLYAEAQAAMAQSDWNAAMAALDQLLSIEPGYKDAVTLLKQAQAAMDISVKDDWQQSNYEQGIQFMEQGNWQDARIALEKVVAVDSNYENVQNLLAETRARLKSKPDPVKVPGTRAAGWQWVGIILAGMGLALIGGVVTILIIQPRMLGNFYFKRQQFNKAATVFEKIWRRNTGDPENNARLAEIYFRQKREDLQAIHVYESVILNDLNTPIKSEISTIVAYHYLSNGNTDAEKIEILEKVMHREINKIKATRGR
jgi:tetratricopeptide (TPR) repeat protein